MTPDTDFDPRAAAFESDIYGSSKGVVRLAVLWDDLLAAAPALASGGLSVLDAGGGSGHLAVRLARASNHVVLADPSAEMLRLAGERLREQGVVDSVRLVRASIDELPGEVHETFDLVACHAVLEWLADPASAAALLPRFLKPDGALSLMFYNRNAAVLKRALAGDFEAALEVQRRGSSEAPVPLDEAGVRRWLEDAGLAVVSRAGIRIFHDHLDPELARNNLDGLIALEQAMRSVEPFASLAQHIHLVCRRA
jgi:S-adenosylmethionine-dependent methyltransferase